MEKLKKQNLILLILLALQGALGMFTNLFVQFPESGTQGQYWEFAWSQPSTAGHVILGIGLFIGSLGFMVRSVRSGYRPLKISAILGFVAIVGAGASGAQFIPAQNDLWSYAMSIFFLLAFLAYAWGLASQTEIYDRGAR